MYIQDRTQLPFQSLYRGESIKYLLKRKPSREFKSELGSIERTIRKNNLHKKENVDIILNHDGSKFYGVISSKEQGVPSNPAYRCSVAKDKNSMSFFTDWVNVWDEAYSPEELKKYRDLMRFIKNGFKKDS